MLPLPQRLQITEPGRVVGLLIPTRTVYLRPHARHEGDQRWAKLGFPGTTVVTTGIGAERVSGVPALPLATPGGKFPLGWRPPKIARDREPRRGNRIRGHGATALGDFRAARRHQIRRRTRFSAARTRGVLRSFGRREIEPLKNSGSRLGSSWAGERTHRSFQVVQRPGWVR